MGKQERVTATASICGASLIIPFIYSFPTIDESLKPLPRIVFQGFGLYQKDLVLLAKGESANTLRALAVSSDSDISTCSLRPDQTMISGAELLWHGLGSRSLIKVGAGKSNKADSRLTLDSSTIQILSNPREICTDLYTNPQTLTTEKIPFSDSEINQIKLQLAKKMELANRSIWKLDTAEFIENANHTPSDNEGTHHTNKAPALCKSIEPKLQELAHIDCKSPTVKFTTQTISKPADSTHRSENTKNTTTECSECQTLFIRLHFRRRTT